MEKKTVVLLAEDDTGHANLVKMNLKRSSLKNKFIHFLDGEEILNFLYKKGNEPHIEEGVPYIILLDIRMPKIDGIEVLRQIKQDNGLSKIPVIMVTTTDDPDTIEKCNNLGCNRYVVKPVVYDAFENTIQQLGKYIKSQLLH